jgi:hypothetical protein
VQDAKIGIYEPLSSPYTTETSNITSPHLPNSKAAKIRMRCILALDNHPSLRNKQVLDDQKAKENLKKKTAPHILSPMQNMLIQGETRDL